MTIKRMTEGLLLQLEGQGYRGRIVSIQHLRDLQEEIEGRHRQGLFCEEFYQERLAWFKFSPPDSLLEAKSLIVVAVPDPQTQVTFTWEGRRVTLIVPPTYLHWQKVNKKAEDLLAETLNPQGYRVVPAGLPVKLLAVHSGLGAYGKNNVTYVPGMGSFHRLAAFYSDFPCQEDSWQEAKMMDACQKCRACLHRCPTDAITSDRFLLHAERCITFHNEKPKDIPFPEWINPSWHNCLVGCLRCQRVCPENRDFLEWVVGGEEFSQEETALLLEGVPRDQLPTATVKKLEWLDLMEYFDCLPRNLGVMLEKRGEH